MSVEQRLKELKITLPKVGSPLGNYVHAKRVGNLLYLSGKGPERADGTMPRGKLGAGLVEICNICGASGVHVTFAPEGFWAWAAAVAEREIANTARY